MAAKPETTVQDCVSTSTIYNTVFLLWLPLYPKNSWLKLQNVVGRIKTPVLVSSKAAGDVPTDWTAVLLAVITPPPSSPAPDVKVITNNDMMTVM